jgi:hypothetical protein
MKFYLVTKGTGYVEETRPVPFFLFYAYRQAWVHPIERGSDGRVKGQIVSEVSARCDEDIPYLYGADTTCFGQQSASVSPRILYSDMLIGDRNFKRAGC